MNSKLDYYSDAWLFLREEPPIKLDGRFSNTLVSVRVTLRFHSYRDINVPYIFLNHNTSSFTTQ